MPNRFKDLSIDISGGPSCAQIWTSDLHMGNGDKNFVAACILNEQRKYGLRLFNSEVKSLLH